MLPSTLIARLRSVAGVEGVIDRPEALLVYECDGYTLERAAPEAVVLPRTSAEVAGVLRVLAAERIAFVPRGAQFRPENLGKWRRRFRPSRTYWSIGFRPIACRPRSHLRTG